MQMQIQPIFTVSKIRSLDRDSSLKLFLTVGFVLVALNILALFYHQPAGYVVDIYSQLPPFFFWTALLCYLIAAFAVFLGHANGRMLGALLLALNHAVILLIPYMLGYYSMGRADDMSYIGEYEHISNTGSISAWNIYPASPILGAIVQTLTGLQANEVAFIIPIIFSFVLVCGLYLGSRFFLSEEKQIQIALLTSFVLYLGPYNFLNVPHALFFAYIPLYLFGLLRYIQNRSVSNAVLIIIPTVLIPFMHPFIVLFVFSLLLMQGVPEKLVNRFILADYRSDIRPLSLLILGFFSWFIYNSTLMMNFAQSYYAFILRSTETVLLGTVSKLSSANLDPFSLINFIFIYYGRYIIPLLVILLGCYYVYLNRNIIRGSIKNTIILLFFVYLISFFIEIILFINPIISHQPDRLTNLNFIVYAQVPLFTLSLYVLISSRKDFIRQTILPIILIVGIWSLSFWGAFASPYTFKTSEALTYNEVDGMTWFFESRSYDLVLTPLSQLDRFQDLFDDHDRPIYMAFRSHFGYKAYDRSLIEATQIEDQKFYAVLLTTDELLYQTVPGYKEVGRFTSDDYARFRNDRSIDGKIYDNINIEIYA